MSQDPPIAPRHPLNAPDLALPLVLAQSIKPDEEDRPDEEKDRDDGLADA